MKTRIKLFALIGVALAVMATLVSVNLGNVRTTPPRGTSTYGSAT